MKPALKNRGEAAAAGLPALAASTTAGKLVRSSSWSPERLARGAGGWRASNCAPFSHVAMVTQCSKVRRSTSILPFEKSLTGVENDRRVRQARRNTSQPAGGIRRTDLPSLRGRGFFLLRVQAILPRRRDLRR